MELREREKRGVGGPVKGEINRRTRGRKFQGRGRGRKEAEGASKKKKNREREREREHGGGECLSEPWSTIKRCAYFVPAPFSILTLATAATRPLLAKPNVLRLASPLSTLPCLPLYLVHTLSLFSLHVLSLRGYSRYAFSSMYSTNATAIKRSPLRSTGREEKERGERGCKSILHRCSSDCRSRPLNWAVGRDRKRDLRSTLSKMFQQGPAVVLS